MLSRWLWGRPTKEETDAAAKLQAQFRGINARKDLLGNQPSAGGEASAIPPDPQGAASLHERLEAQAQREEEEAQARRKTKKKKKKKKRGEKQD